MKICQQCGTQYDGTQSFCPRDGEVLRDDHAEMVGRVLDGQYEIESFIAEGGMGAVYQARHTLLGDKVAIKILPPEMRRNSAWLKRFQREGQAARRFHHPNSVIVHDLRTSSEGEIYLVMEFVEGRTLDEEVAAHGGRLSLTEALKIIEAVASALDAAHAQGVVHRDLKPSNIMITNRGIVKVLDLGVAKVSDQGSGTTNLTVTGQLLGTPYFMSPEQWGELPRDGSEEIDGRTDIYSLGVVVYKITTGEFPFKGTSVVTIRRAHCREAPRPLQDFDPNIPQGWSNAVLRAVAKDRGDRQTTAGEFAAELRAAIDGIDVRRDSARAVLPTLVAEPPQPTSPVVHSTPLNLYTPTASTNPDAQIIQQPAQAYHRSASYQSASHQSASFQAPSPKAAQKKLILLAVLVSLVFGAGGFALWKLRGNDRPNERRGARQARNSANDAGDSSANTDSTAPNTDSTTPDTDSTAPAGDGNAVLADDDAFIRYNLLLSPSVLDSAVIASGRDPVKTGQIVQFDFRFGESGYLYMFGHDDAGNHIIMPLSGDGLENLKAGARVEAGTETVVPSLPIVKLDAPSGTESFMVIFSSKPLTYSFVNATLPLSGSFRKLTADEERALDDLRKQAVSATLKFNGDIVVVNPESAHGSKPVIFDIKIKLQRS